MSMRINYNGAAANAWRNLGVNDEKLAGSVEKLSSGLRINKGADDPAGLIISERLKAQITGLGQAVQNAQEATSLVQTAEGALTEMNNMLNKMRGLAVGAANSGVNDTDTIAANQRQIDSALESLQKIAQNTKYQSKILLDGSANNAATDITDWSASIAAVDIKGTMDSAATGAIDVKINTAAQRAVVTGTPGAYDSDVAHTLTIASSDFAAKTISIGINTTATQAADQINNYYSETGVWANASAASTLQFTFSAYGSDKNITISANDATVLGNAQTSKFAAGKSATGEMTLSDNKVLSMTGSTTNGLELTVDSGAEFLVGTKVTIVGADATDTTQAGGRAGAGSNAGGDRAATYSSVYSVTTGALQFSLGQDASSNEIRTLTISNMQVTAVGKGATGIDSEATLNSIKTGGDYELSKNAANAVKIIDKAIDDVSISRATLGAFQQNALETTINTLSINKENLEASNSRITDVDMAQEMMQFTKSQILTQAGTAMLAQANQLPQSVLRLLQG